jgi:hypothetical protein
MIKDKLKTALTAAGCTLVVYESTQLANIITDQSHQTDIIGLALEPQNFTLEQAGNGVQERYQATVEILKQVLPEDTAEHNEATLQSLLTVAKLFIHSLTRTGSFYRIPSVPITKVTEKQYDANVIGWSLALDLKYVGNANNC